VNHGSLAALKGCGQQLVSSVGLLVCYYCIAAPLGLYLAYGCEMNVLGMWMAYGIADAILVMFYSFRVYLLDFNKIVIETKQRLEEDHPKEDTSKNEA
jgi:hypothetical protein